MLLWEMKNALRGECIFYIIYKVYNNYSLHCYIFKTVQKELEQSHIGNTIIISISSNIISYNKRTVDRQSF